LFGLNGKKLQRQYKEHLSNFKNWKQKRRAKEWLVFPENMGEYLSIDETSLSDGELYTILTNKAAKGKKGSIIAIISGIKAADIMKVLRKIPEPKRKMVKEVTLDMAANMGLAIKKSFPWAKQVTDQFHVQKLAWDAVQEMRIKHRWEALDQESDAIELARAQSTSFNPEVLSNGDTLKQLLARSRYVLYKRPANWSKSQAQRAALLFERYPDIEKAFGLGLKLAEIYDKTTDQTYGLARLAKWHEDVRQAGFKSFNSIARTFEHHYRTILNYFDNRCTNASDESFNAKIKAFRSRFRGVRSIEFFLFRLCQIYA
jgi:transposase